MSELKTILSQTKENLSATESLNLTMTTTTSPEMTGGQMKAFEPIRHFANMPALPMLNLFFAKPAQPTFYTKALLTFYKPSDQIPTTSIAEGGCPVEVDFEKFDIAIPISSNSVVKTFTDEAINNLTSEFSLRKIANPEAENSVLNLADMTTTTALLRSMESLMITGTIPTTGALAGRGILGLIPTMVKVNGAIPAVGTTSTNGTNNGRYNTNAYSTSQLDQAIQDLMYSKVSLEEHGVTHSVILIPMGTWQTFSMSYSIANQMTPDTFKQIITNAEQNINAARGSRGSIYGDAHKRHYLDDSTDVVEVKMPAGYMILYPDMISGEYGFQEHALTTPEKGLPNGNTIRPFIYASNDRILAQVGLNTETYQQYASNTFGQNNICNGIAFGREWKGRFVFSNVAFAKLYISVASLTPASYSVASTVTNGAVIDLAA
jgi:hypothetical protein